MASSQLPKEPADSATAQAVPVAASRPLPKEDKAATASTGRMTAYGHELQEETSVAALLSAALRQTPSWLVSAVVHMILLLALAIWNLPPGIADDLREVIVAPKEVEEFDELEDFEDEPLEEIPLELASLETETIGEEVDIPAADDVESAAVKVDLSDFGLEHAPRGDLLVAAGSYTGSGLSGRGKGRGNAIKAGGSVGSEKAVDAALKWLAEHQMPDGGWNFAHHMCPRCDGQCRNPGYLVQARTGATALAVLPFLGAGQTHKSGKYKSVVQRGLYFLTSRMRISPQGGDMYEPGGQMYSHGLASIALCEAYAMTHDKKLHVPAQASINFICYAQDPVGGGWRYKARQRGDTSVVGWQIMALKSGHMADLNVPPITVKRAFQYLDTVQADGGAFYGYQVPAQGPATTAIGLLCRMYLGWKKDNPALQRGVAWLGSQGPSAVDMYYNYYATQVMRHWEGEPWEKWNSVMRDQLVDSQSRSGHEAGSWHFGKGDHGSEHGGRLYATSMATMILEVYYRHLPIYRKQSTEEDFPE